jgi:hypothetical protein
LLNTHAALVEKTEHELPCWVSLFCGFSCPTDCFILVFINADTEHITMSKSTLCHCESLFGELPELLCCLFFVLVNTVPHDITNTSTIQCRRRSLIGECCSSSIKLDLFLVIFGKAIGSRRAVAGTIQQCFWVIFCRFALQDITRSVPVNFDRFANRFAGCLRCDALMASDQTNDCPCQ